MEMFLGADTEQVLGQARALRDGDRQLAAMQESLHPLVMSVQWVGPDADAMRERWQRAREQILDAAAQLGSGAESLALEAAQQDAVSDPEGTIDVASYDGLVGGEGWSDVINFFEGAADPFRDRVDTESLGGSWAADHPEWRPEDVGVSEADIREAQMQQGVLGDCWYLSALMAAQRTNPRQLAENITGLGTPPGSEGWEVELFLDGQWQPITVTPDQIGQQGARDTSSGGWADAVPGFMSIYEQALITASDGSPSAISADSPAAGIEMITGRDTSESTLDFQPSFDEYRAAIDAGQPVTVMTDPIMPLGPNADELVAAHVYEVSGYDRSTGEIILTNPHGPDAASQYEVRVDPEDPGFAHDIVMTGIGE
jgi:hypothetical protein